MQYIIYISLPTNKVVLDRYIRSILVNIVHLLVMCCKYVQNARYIQFHYVSYDIICFIESDINSRLASTI